MFPKAFNALDRQLKRPTSLLIGGGAALLLAHKIPLSSKVVDGLLFHTETMAAELERLVKEVARELKIGHHWFSSDISTFTYTIPPDFKKRLVTVYKGRSLKVSAFGLEDLLIMKCFRSRERDIGHARAIVKMGADLNLVEEHIHKLLEKGTPRRVRGTSTFLTK